MSIYIYLYVMGLNQETPLEGAQPRKHVEAMVESLNKDG